MRTRLGGRPGGDAQLGEGVGHVPIYSLLPDKVLSDAAVRLARGQQAKYLKLAWRRGAVPRRSNCVRTRPSQSVPRLRSGAQIAEDPQCRVKLQDRGVLVPSARQLSAIMTRSRGLPGWLELPPEVQAGRPGRRGRPPRQGTPRPPLDWSWACRPVPKYSASSASSSEPPPARWLTSPIASMISTRRREYRVCWSSVSRLHNDLRLDAAAASPRPPRRVEEGLLGWVSYPHRLAPR